MDETIRRKEIYKVTLVGSALNALLIVLKFVGGIVGRSSAMVADAVHSLSDFVTDVIVLVFVKIAGKPRDESHEYGHGKYETLATMLIGVLLVLAGIGLLVGAVELIIKSLHGTALPRPGWIALIVALASIVSKEWLYHYTVRHGRRLNSPAVEANAWHHRSDALSSAGTLVGIAGAMFLPRSWRILDPLAAAIVSLFIIKSGIDIIRPAVSELLEAALPADQQKQITDTLLDVPGIEKIHNLRTRRVGNSIAIDVHTKMDGDLSLRQAHAIATQAENALRRRFGPQSIINIHMEPLS